MTQRFWIALPLAAALMTPALAQTSNPQNQNPPAATSNQNSDTSQPSTQAPAAQPAPSASDQQSVDQKLSAMQPLSPERHEGFWGKINPFARKKYVQRQVQPIRDRANELDELTAANAKMIRDVDSRATEGIRLASNKANEADQHAVDAGNRAQMAHQTAQQASTRLNTVEQVVGNIDQYQGTTQTELRFRPGQMALSKKAKTALDEMAEPLKSQKGYVIEVQGFSSGKGQEAVENSQRMAQSVVRYLVLNHEIPVYRIYLLGMGNAPIPATTAGAKPRRTTGGRVEVSLLKNNVDQLGSEAAPTVTGTEGGVSGTTAAPAQQQNQQPATQPGSWNAQPSSNMNAQPAAPMNAPATTEQPSANPQPQSPPPANAPQQPPQ